VKCEQPYKYKLYFLGKTEEKHQKIFKRRQNY